MVFMFLGKKLKLLLLIYIFFFSNIISSQSAILVFKKQIEKFNFKQISESYPKYNSILYDCRINEDLNKNWLFSDDTITYKFKKIKKKKILFFLNRYLKVISDKTKDKTIFFSKQKFLSKIRNNELNSFSLLGEWNLSSINSRYGFYIPKEIFNNLIKIHFRRNNVVHNLNIGQLIEHQNNMYILPIMKNLQENYDEIIFVIKNNNLNTNELRKLKIFVGKKSEILKNYYYLNDKQCFILTDPNNINYNDLDYIFKKKKSKIFLSRIDDL